VVRVRSSDLLHSFAIPLLHIGPVDVPAGHTVEVQFEATRPGVLTFLCWQVCSMQHDKLRGRFVVKSRGAPEGW
jgi:heme/copper-type cytochrome/quinol oxidase subunit 2